jgi:hypothetical protein
MNPKELIFDQVFNIWLEAETQKPGLSQYLDFVRGKGFNSISEWRLDIALKFGLDKLQWRYEEIHNPGSVLPNILIGPYKGWSIFFENKLATSFEDLLKIKEAVKWCSSHDRIIPIPQNFPELTRLILLEKPDGSFVHIEGGHRCCAVAYMQRKGTPIDFLHRKVFAAIAPVTEDQINNLIKFARPS